MEALEGVGSLELGEGQPTLTEEAWEGPFLSLGAKVIIQLRDFGLRAIGAARVLQLT